MTTILVTGANGQVGQELQVLAPQYHNFRFLFTDRALLDITNQAAVQYYFANHTIHYCINCAAYTAVDKAESEPDLAHNINIKGVMHLAEACKSTGAQLIHISSDYVYHNLNCTPLNESDPTFPQSVYAQTKLDGEQAALNIYEQTMVIRTSWVYSSFGHNFVKTMLRLGKERPELRVVYDQIGTPTYARDLAKAILDIIQKAEKNIISRDLLYGIYNYSNEGVTSWYDFAKAIFEIAHMDCKVTPIETKDYPTPAKRPPFSVLNKDKIKAAFALEIPHWKDSLLTCLEVILS
ncbi:MAG: dTDP-4-dehydrorhamnose reductase [Saprospiraceae bacterium]